MISGAAVGMKSFRGENANCRQAGRKMRALLAAFKSLASIALLCLLPVAVSACAGARPITSVPLDPQARPDYSLAVLLRGEPVWDDDSYEVSLGFELRAPREFDYNAIIQEIVQEVVYERYDGRAQRETLTLVEAFRLARVGVDENGLMVYRLPSFQRDRHYERGYRTVGGNIREINVWRVVRCYPGYVADADWTPLGFAHLPRNRTGGLVTDIPDNFNQSHQRSHAPRGEILLDDREGSRWYHIRYHWWRDEARRPRADFRFVEYARPDDEPEWLTATLDHGTRQASAGE
jgi:hypothetical protein